MTNYKPIFRAKVLENGVYVSKLYLIFRRDLLLLLQFAVIEIPHLYRLLERIPDSLSRAAPYLAAVPIAETEVGKLDKAGVKLSHTAVKVSVGCIYHTISFIHYAEKRLFLLCAPIPCLIFGATRQDKVQCYLWVNLAELQNGLGCYRIKSYCAACAVIHDPAVNYRPFELIIHIRSQEIKVSG